MKLLKTFYITTKSLINLFYNSWILLKWTVNGLNFWSTTFNDCYIQRIRYAQETEKNKNFIPYIQRFVTTHVCYGRVWLNLDFFFFFYYSWYILLTYSLNSWKQNPIFKFVLLYYYKRNKKLKFLNWKQKLTKKKKKDYINLILAFI